MAVAAPREGSQVRECADWGLPYRLFVLLRTSQQEQDATEAFAQALDAFHAFTLQVLAREGRATLRHRSGYLFLNGRRLPVDFRAFHATRFLVELFRSCRIGGLRFTHGLTRREAAQTARALLAGERRDRFALAAGLAAAEVDHVQFLAETLRGHDPLVPRAREKSRRNRETQFRSLFITKRILGGIREGNGVDVRLAKRIVHGIVDLILEEPAALADLTRLSEAGSALFDHSLNVAVLAVVIGQELRLPRRLIGALGMAALFHDIGLAAEQDCGAHGQEAHPVDGFLDLLQDRELGDLALRVALVAREHHLGLRGEGPADRGPTLLSRIVAVADAYERALAGPAGAEPAEPAAVLERLAAGSERFDPEVAAALGAALARAAKA